MCLYIYLRLNLYTFRSKYRHNKGMRPEVKKNSSRGKRALPEFDLNILNSYLSD